MGQSESKKLTSGTSPSKEPELDSFVEQFMLEAFVENSIAISWQLVEISICEWSGKESPVKLVMGR